MASANECVHEQSQLCFHEFFFWGGGEVWPHHAYAFGSKASPANSSSTLRTEFQVMAARTASKMTMSKNHVSPYGTVLMVVNYIANTWRSMP